MPNLSWARRLAPYPIAVCLCLALLVWVLELWRADFRAPLRNDADCILIQAWVKNVLLGGSYSRTDRAGAPYGMDLRDFPISETLHLGVMKALSLGSKNPYRIITCFFLFTFVFTTLTALFVLRHFGVATVPAVICSLLYAFQPYHFWRGVAHLFLAAYYLIPLSVMVTLWVYLGRMQRAPGESARAPRLRWAFGLPFCFLVAWAGIYFAFFGCFFLLLAGLACALRQRRLAPALGAGVLAAATSLGLGVNLLPTWLYHRQEGPNPVVPFRLPAAAELVGLKMTQMLLPVTHHRFGPFRELKDHYNNARCLPVVNDYGNSLGLVGAVGFVFLLLCVLRPPAGEDSLFLFGLGVFAVAGFLLGTVGGGGSLIAFLVTPQLRGYDRISIYLAFFALLGVAWLLTRLVGWAGRYGWAARLGVTAFCGLVLAGGIYDQTTPANVPPYQALKDEYESMARFTARVEEALPDGAMVFQLPFVEFPEGEPIHLMTCYDHLRLYVHARRLRISHGTTMGHYDACALKEMSSRPLEVLLPALARMGYSGIHIDRRGYPDGGRQVEAQLQAALGAPPLVSADGRDLFFNLLPYVARLKSGSTEQEWARQQRDYRYPVAAVWDAGCYPEDGTGDHRCRWCRAEGSFVLVNPLPEPRAVTIRFQASAALAAEARLTLSGPLFDASLRISDKGPVAFSRTVVVPPGRHRVRFHCDGDPLYYPPLVFNFANFEVLKEEPTSILAQGDGPR